MLSPPDDLTPAVLADALGRTWALAVATMEYRPVGWGSHHWEVVDTLGGRWFITVDDLLQKRHTREEPLDLTFLRLQGSLSAAVALREQGHTFVVAPVLGAPSTGGPLSGGTSAGPDSVVRVGDRFALAVYPFVVGESFEWGAFSSPEHRVAVLELMVTLHSAPVPAAAPVDRFAIPQRDDLVAALDGMPSTEDGPYAARAAHLLTRHAAPIRRLLARYDELVSRADPSRMVLTHGEPHPGNTMRSPQGWLLIDWDTLLVAQPERDLWALASQTPSIVDDYASATGVTPRPDMLELFGVRWNIADIAVDVARFRRGHADTPDDAQSFKLLTSLVTSLKA
jgi:spectinomycin phosphotransferase/16S rRNA (guanine(1405)-N(7))-methyltransferase